MQWDSSVWNNNERALDSITVTLGGTDAEKNGKSHYGVLFRDMDLYLSAPEASATLLSSESIAVEGQGYSAGAMAGVGLAAVILGVSIHSVFIRKKQEAATALLDFERV